MAQERRNPIPPGKYYVDVVDDTLQRRGALKGFRAWVEKNKSTVKVLKHERTIEPMGLDNLFDAARPQLDWFLFQVSEPTKRWPKSVPIGFPDIASQQTTKRKDVHKRPPEKGVVDYWTDQAPKINTPLGLGGAVGALLVLWALTRK